MGDLYPFSLNQKLAKITEPSPWYSGAGQSVRATDCAVGDGQRAAAICCAAGWAQFRGPAVGLFADQEIRMIDGPLVVGEDYEIEREIVALSGSRRTKSYWTRTFVYRPGETKVIATMLLNQATLEGVLCALRRREGAALPRLAPTRLGRQVWGLFSCGQRQINLTPWR